MADSPISADPLITDPALIDRIPVISAGVNKAITYPDLVNGLVAANISDFDAEVSNNTDVAASKTITDNISVTQAVDLDTIETDSTASKTITDFISVTQAVDLDTMESDIASNTPIDGTFTPTFQDDSRSDAEGQTYTAQDGTFQRIGNTIHFRASVILLSQGSLTGANKIVMGGLPVVSSSVSGSSSACTIGNAGGLTVTAGTSLSGYISPNTSFVVIQSWDATDGSTGLTVTEFGTGSMIISGTYLV